MQYPMNDCYFRVLVENGVKLSLTVIDTPGFGDLLEGDDSWKACVKYVDDQFAAYFDVRFATTAYTFPNLKHKTHFRARAASTGRTSLTRGCTAASTSYPPTVTGSGKLTSSSSGAFNTRSI